MTRDAIHDFVAIGLGPFNLSLACLTEPLSDLDGVFLERNMEFNWHPGILIDGTTLQNPFLADLVSLADPCSRFSFLNYCKEEGRIYAFYIRENYYLDRTEYNRYCRWVVSRLSNIRFQHDVREIRYDKEQACYVVEGVRGESRLPFSLRCRRLVVGVGTLPALPPCCGDRGHRYLHTADYLDNKQALLQRRSITIVGSGQSAAEVYYDLLKASDAHDYSLTWLTRSPGFFQMENTKLTLEMISPDYIDYFYHLPEGKREALLGTQGSLYKGVNASLINQIYDLLDDKRKRGTLRSHLVSNCEVRECRYDLNDDSYDIRFRQVDHEEDYRYRSDSVIFATGYEHRVPALIDGIRDRIRWDANGRYRLAHNYTADFNGNEIFVQNGGLHTHGLTNIDIGMSCHRNAYIIREMTGIDYYKLEQRIAIQDFAVPEGAGFVRLSEAGSL
ncbi:lysine/ornithine N-monooxygenase [Azoarcus olearius]|uniref:lysine N(6)-hydroxylase/L-ornithine N(5)-oxygenase family protein n=1 Tax=Azoarcus sp. (strain BH72) TaxID=418699 RepID=UPI00080636FF|nr:SidA/IucD/PvdA family monooxygenase [Azoarcus olearius]ANQ85697.1 lysine/ornithine N-monooxygenase [Azoarcus olearius]